MKRIILSTLLALIACAAAAQDMSVEQIKALQDKAKELHPTNANQRNAWLKMQSNAFESIKYANYTLSKAELDSIKEDAKEKFPNDYVEQEEHIRNQANTLISLNHLAKGIDPKEFMAIKQIVTEESNGNPDEYMSLMQIHMECKDRIKHMAIPNGVDEVDFKIMQRVIEKNYQYNYRKQFEEMQKKIDMLASLNSANNPTLKNDPNAYNTIATELLKNNTLYTSNADPKLAVAVKFKNKLGFFCPISAYSDKFEIMTPLGESVNITDIHFSKDVPVMFLEVTRLPSGIDTIEIGSLDDIKVNLSRPLVLTGYFSSTKSSNTKTSINSIRDNNYILATKTPVSFTDGTMLVDFENRKLLSFTIRDNTSNKIVPDFSERAKAILAINSASNSTAMNINPTYPIIETLNDFELLDSHKMKLQEEYLAKLIKDNEEAFKLYTSTSLSSLVGTAKYDKIAKDSIPRFKEALGETGFKNAAKTLMSKLVNKAMEDFNPNINTSLFYVNLRSELEYQIKLRNNMIEYFQKAITNDLDSILPRDITSARAEPKNKNKKKW